MSVGERFDLSVGSLYARKRGAAALFLLTFRPAPPSFIVKAAIGQALVVGLFRG